MTSNHTGSRGYSQLLISLNSIKGGRKKFPYCFVSRFNKKTENLKISNPVDLS